MPAESAHQEDQTETSAAAAAQATPAPEEKQAAPAPDKAPPEKAPEGESKEGESAAPKTALDAAKRVMAKEQKAGSEAKPQEGEQPKPQAETDKSKAEDDDANLPFKDHPRWKKMSSENRILQVAKEKNEEAIKALQPKAKGYDDLTGYLRENNLGKEDFSNLLAIGVAVRNNPMEAYRMLKPVMEQLEGLVGERLPPDLQAKVDSGVIDAETARELARTRSAEHLAKSRAETVEKAAQREREEREVRDQEAQQNVVVQTLNAWDDEWVKRDPDAAKLRPMLNDLVVLWGSQKPPRNADEARQLAEAALVEVKKRASAWTPPPQPKTGILPAGGAPSNSAPIPKSSLEAAQAALR